MALTPAPALGSSGLDQLSLAQLMRTARLLAADPELPGRLDPRSRESQWVELESGPELQAWLLSWPVGAQNGWHDHGESAGAFQVVNGTLLEQTSAGHRRAFRTLIAGEGRTFEPNHLHNLSNVRAGTALSVHVYAPSLTQTTRYAITPTGLQPGVTDLPGADW